jgi:hypothetical protein
VLALENLGVAERGGFWEQAAAANPGNSGGGGAGTTGTTGGGGLRIITGAGIYVDGTTILMEQCSLGMVPIQLGVLSYQHRVGTHDLSIRQETIHQNSIQSIILIQQIRMLSLNS